MIKIKLFSAFILSLLLFSACTTSKLALQEVAVDPIYTTVVDINKIELAIASAEKREQLEFGASANQGKQSGNQQAKYDYMPATSYAQRFNRTGSGFFMDSRFNQVNNFNSNIGFGFGRPAHGSMFNPYDNFNQRNAFNPWCVGAGDPYWSFRYMNGFNNYPFFTYNPYMFSYGMLTNFNDPWMMQNSFYDPYFYNPYYFYNPNANFQNPFCPFNNSFRTANTRTAPNYVNQRRNTAVGNNTSNGRTNNTNNNNRTFETGNNNTGANRNSTFGNSGAGTSRGGYSTEGRAERGTGGSTGTKRR